MNTQNHIHLSLALGAGPENAPTLKWKVVSPDYTLIPNVIMSVRRSVTGKAHLHVLKVAGVPAVFKDYEIRIKVAAEGGEDYDTRLNYLLAMHGREVYFCPARHENDGVSHTPSVRRMLCQVGAIKAFHQPSDINYVEVMLHDNETVR
jgi:hypothetical protein